MQDGSLIGFAGRAWSSIAIQVLTYGLPLISLSHVGIISDGRLYEAEEQGVQESDPSERIGSYEGKAWHYGLYRPLYDHEAERLTAFLNGTLGRPYDRRGAARAGGKLYSAIESILRPADLTSFFCSELVAAAHATIGLFQTGHVSRWSPNGLIRAERRQGILMAPRRIR